MKYEIYTYYTHRGRHSPISSFHVTNLKPLKSKHIGIIQRTNLYTYIYLSAFISRDFKIDLVFAVKRAFFTYLFRIFGPLAGPNCASANLRNWFTVAALPAPTDRTRNRLHLWIVCSRIRVRTKHTKRMYVRNFDLERKNRIVQFSNEILTT